MRCEHRLHFGFEGVTLPPQAVLNICLHVYCAKINVLLHSDSGLDFDSEF